MGWREQLFLESQTHYEMSGTHMESFESRTILVQKGLSSFIPGHRASTKSDCNPGMGLNPT